MSDYNDKHIDKKDVFSIIELNYMVWSEVTTRLKRLIFNDLFMSKKKHLKLKRKIKILIQNQNKQHENPIIIANKLWRVKKHGTFYDK